MPHYSPRTLRRFCYAASSLLLVGSVGLVAWGLQPPAPPAAPPALTVKPATAAGGHADGPQLAQWQALWRKRLQRSAADAPTSPEDQPTEAMPAPASTTLAGSDSAFGLRLAGTVLESGKSMAVLVDQQGRIMLRGVGETIATDTGPAAVQRVELHTVRLSHQGREVTLRLSSSGGDQ